MLDIVRLSGMPNDPSYCILPCLLKSHAGLSGAPVGTFQSEECFSPPELLILQTGCFISHSHCFVTVPWLASPNPRNIWHW